MENDGDLFYEEISIGVKRAKFPIPDGFEDIFIKSSMGLYDSTSKTIGVPVVINIKNGAGFLVEYRNENECDILDGIHNFILNALRYSNEYKQIIYIDPVRYNNSSLGILQPLSVGKNSAIDSVPLSIEETRKKLNSLITQINIDEHNRIPTTDGRLIRRIVRDNRTRGTKAKDTIAMWPSVRRGEDENIFPYQGEADVMFNSALLYEMAVLKQYVEPVLFGIDKNLRNSVRIEKVAEKESIKFSVLDLEEIAGRLHANGITNYICNKPTHYLCNEAYWFTLRKFNGKAVFIHIPSIKNTDDNFILIFNRSIGKADR